MSGDLRVTVFLGEYDHRRRHLLALDIADLARKSGLAEAVVLRGCEGYGAHGRLHTDRILSLAEDLPAVVVVVDAEAKVRPFLTGLEGLAVEGTVLVERVELRAYGDLPERS